ncbi:heparinase II/III family protein [Eubacterium multiforme]|nr:heparinase II/III family protein [Eubacterium multiforme]
MVNRCSVLKNNSTKFMKNFKVENVRKYCKENFKDDCKGIIEKADLLLENSFIFEEKWDMEQCPIKYTLDSIDWLKSPNGDEEWIFMLNRQEYLYQLVTAFYLTGEIKYINKWKFFVLDWIEKNKLDTNNPIPSCRVIDTGIRCLSWVRSLLLIGSNEFFSDEELNKIIESLDEQTEYLKDMNIEKYRLSNWGVLQTTGMIASKILTKEDYLDDEIFKWALDRYEEQMNIQIFNDGLQWEQSPMYHVEVLLSSLKLINLMIELNAAIPTSILDSTKNMSKPLIHTTKPNYRQIMQSDSDDTDTRDILVKASMLFEDGELKFRGYSKADFDSAWYFGSKYINIYNELPKIEPKEKNKYFEDAGNLYLRNNWSEDSTFSYFHNGTMGGGHGHADLLHYNIVYKGKDFLIDPGRYTYLENNKYRYYLKSCYAHNTIVIDNEPFTVVKSSWDYYKLAEPLKNYVKLKDGISYIEMPLVGILNNKQEYMAIRKVINIEPNMWIIVDNIKLRGKHKINKFYHLDEDVKYEVKNNISFLEKENEDVIIRHFNIDKLMIKDDVISKHFNVLTDSKTLVSEKNFEDSIVSFDVIYGKENEKDIKIKIGNLYQQGKRIPLDEKEATALEIEYSNKKYIITITHNEIFDGSKLLKYNNEISIYGKVIVIEKCDNQTKYIKLKY